MDLWIGDLEVGNFRNLKDAHIPFAPGLNWLVGSNGHGKTNCLEAVYYVLTTKSFRTASPAELIRTGASAMKVSADVRRLKQSLQFSVVHEEGKVRRMLGGKACPTMDFFRNGAAMAFTARSKSLVEGQPQDRRQFLDRMIAYLEPDFIVTLSKYKKVLGQLKRILLQRGSLGVYRGFKTSAVDLAHQIVEKRMTFLNDMKPLIQTLYRDLFSTHEEPGLEYQIKNCPDFEKYRTRLLDISAQEILHGRSFMGPHLDDLDIQLLQGQARRLASSGQVRAIVLSTKLAVRQLYLQRREVYPVLLLDDIDAELDEERLERLLTYLGQGGQTIISTSKYGKMMGSAGGHVFTVNAGLVRLERNPE